MTEQKKQVAGQETEGEPDERTLNYAQECLRQLRDPRLAHREHEEAAGQEETELN